MTQEQPRSGAWKPTDRPALVLVGPGAAGTGLGLALHQARWPIDAVVSRRGARASERSRLIGAGRPLDLEALLHDPFCDGAPRLLLLTVPDGALGEVAQRLATRAWPPGTVALHVSGATPVEALSPLRGAGLSLGGAHPLQSFVDPEAAAASLRGAVFAVEGDERGLGAATAVAQAVGGRPFPLAEGGRMAWHGAAAHAGNHLVALVDQSLDLMAAAGLPRDQARAALLPLLTGTLTNLASHAPVDALTGPVVRGDVEVVAGHLAALDQAPPDVAAAYRALASRAVTLAAARGLAHDRVSALRALLARETDP